MTDGLHVWCFDDCEWVIAESREAALEMLGDPDPQYYDESDLIALDDGEVFAMCIDDATGEVSGEDSTKYHVERLPCSDWIARFGRGYLCTTEY
jgi:hypothetical protein